MIGTLEKELELELEAKTAAEDILKRHYDDAIADATSGDTPLGGKLTRLTYEDVRLNVASLVSLAVKPKRGVKPKYTPFLKELVAIYGADRQDELIHIMTLSALNQCLSGAMKGLGISTIAMKIARNIVDEASLEKFISEASVKGESDTIWLTGDKLRKSIYDGLDKRVRESYKRAYIVNRMRQEGISNIKIGKDNMMALGTELLNAVITGSDYFEIATNGDYNVLVPTEWLSKTWQDNLNRLVKYAHQFVPMVIEPKEWKSLYDGGYYGALSPFAQFIRIDKFYSSKFLTDYKRRLNRTDLSYVFNAVNKMQATAWKINRKVLDVALEIVSKGGHMAGIVSTEPLITKGSQKLPDTATDEEIKAHKKVLASKFKAETSRKSKALRTIMTLSTAKKYADYDEIYFPWNIDYRGRCYPITTSLSPQGDDLQKALLAFTNPAPCESDDDEKWLAIMLANHAGYDKIPFEDRVEWVHKNCINIHKTVYDPLGFTWWADMDSPFEFLATCYEWVAMEDYKKANNNSIIGFKCSIPIAFDGTCSGLQHFSGLLRDEVGGDAVNLTDNETVHDIYGIVAEKVNKVLLNDVVNGTPDHHVLDKEDKQKLKIGTKNLSQAWVTFNRDKFGQDGITRKVCKRSVMTLAYGSGRYGFKENLKHDIVLPYSNEHPETTPFKDHTTQACIYMASLIWDAVKTTVIKAVEGMSYLQALSKLITAKGGVVSWQTPNGLVVQQNYIVEQTKTYQTRISGHKIRFYYKEQTGDVDTRKQRNGIAPNFIHSMDATHLQRVVTEGAKNGITNFAMIHDDFGTDLAHAKQLFSLIRTEYVKLYKDKNWLEYLTNQVKYLLDDDTELPELPKFGKLDIKKILKSKYCFA